MKLRRPTPNAKFSIGTLIVGSAFTVFALVTPQSSRLLPQWALDIAIIITTLCGPFIFIGSLPLVAVVVIHKISQDKLPDKLQDKIL